MFEQDRARLRSELDEIRTAGLWKEERVIQSPQGAWITVNGKQVLCLCANNYLGLANDTGLKQAAKAMVDSHGLGLASVRFICGTQDAHKTLERKVSAFFGTEDTILYSSCFDANGGLFETLMGESDAIISDSLNHASIIDGIRLSKAQRFRYQNGDMAELEQHLQASMSCRSRGTAARTGSNSASSSTCRSGRTPGNEKRSTSRRKFSTCSAAKSHRSLNRRTATCGHRPWTTTTPTASAASASSPR